MGSEDGPESAIRSMLSFRMFTQKDRVGALSLYSTQPYAFTGVDVDSGISFAAHTAIAVVTARHDEDMDTALDARSLIGQATGIVMDRYDIDAVRAFAVLKRISQHTNVKLHEVAAELRPLSVTILQDWSTESLHYELRWQCNAAAPPCAASLMQDAPIDRSAVEAEIARRSVLPETHPEHKQLRSSLAGRMTRQAASLLRDLRFEEAATLFEFAVQENPQDAEALNNLGFCRLPTDPRDARRNLQLSADLGYRPAAVNLCNRVLCTFLVSGAEAAVNLAESEWSNVAHEPSSAYLWALVDGKLTLTDLVDARQHLAGIAESLAKEIGEAAQAATWHERFVA